MGEPHRSVHGLNSDLSTCVVAPAFRRTQPSKKIQYSRLLLNQNVRCCTRWRLAATQKQVLPAVVIKFARLVTVAATAIVTGRKKRVHFMKTTRYCNQAGRWASGACYALQAIDEPRCRETIVFEQVCATLATSTDITSHARWIAIGR